MFRWFQGPPEEPEQGPQQQAHRMQEYSGPWTEKFFRVTIYVTVRRADLDPFPASYALIVPDYNVGAFQDVLNSNGTTYTVEPISHAEEGGDDDEKG